MGSIVASQYGVDCDEKIIDGIICISHNLESKKCVQLLEKPLNNILYNQPMINSLKHIIQKNPFYTEEEKKKVIKMNNFEGYNYLMACKIIGLNCTDE